MKGIIGLALVIFALLLAFFVQEYDLGTQGRIFAALILAYAFLLLTQESIMKDESIHVKNGLPVGRPDSAFREVTPPDQIFRGSTTPVYTESAVALFELRQQLADVSHDRDLLRGLLKRVIDSSALAFEQDGLEQFESLEFDICTALKPSGVALSKPAGSEQV